MSATTVVISIVSTIFLVAKLTSSFQYAADLAAQVLIVVQDLELLPDELFHLLH